MDTDKLNQIIDAHKEWLHGSPLGVCADLEGAGLESTFYFGIEPTGASK